MVDKWLIEPLIFNIFLLTKSNSSPKFTIVIVVNYALLGP